jgi:hypothetical protein
LAPEVRGLKVVVGLFGALRWREGYGSGERLKPRRLRLQLAQSCTTSHLGDLSLIA